MSSELTRRAFITDVEVRSRSGVSPIYPEWLVVNGIVPDAYSSVSAVAGCAVREARYGPFGFDYLHTARFTCVTAIPERRQAVVRLQRAHPRWKVSTAIGWQANITITVPTTPAVSADEFALLLRAAGLPTGPGDVTDTPSTATGVGSGFTVNGYPLTKAQVTVMVTILAELTAQQPTVSPGPPPPPPPA